MLLRVGQRLGIVYSTDPGLVNERIVLCPQHGSDYLLVVPGRQLTHEDLASTNNAAVLMVWVGKANGPILGLQDRLFYRFSDADVREFADDELQEFDAEGQMLSDWIIADTTTF